jgi:hypothetical protein
MRRRRRKVSEVARCWDERSTRRRRMHDVREEAMWRWRCGFRRKGRRIIRVVVPLLQQQLVR